MCAAATKRLQLTLAILKPHVVSNPIALPDIKRIIIDNDFKVVLSRKHRLNLEDAARFYDEHKSKFFYNRLVTFMTSGTSEIYVLARENAIQEWRKLMGPTKVFKTQFEAPDTIRGRYGLSDTRNATHGSDSDESAKREIAIFFPGFNCDDWYRKEECAFKEGDLEFCADDFQHRIKSRMKL